jgi:hypothetical protein
MLASLMSISRTVLAAIVGAIGILFLGTLIGYAWLSKQGPVLSRSEEKDPLSGTPRSILFNPLRDRSAENAALPVIEAMRDGKCADALAGWERDYRKKYARFICNSEAQHPLVSWTLVDWEQQPPLTILHYRATRRSAPGEDSYYKELFTVTIEKNGREWSVTKYDAMY